MDEEIKKLLEENLRLTREIHEMSRKMKNYITFQKVMSVIYFLLIVVPIIISVIYLPPLLGGLFSQYKELLGGSPALDAVSNFNISDLKASGASLEEALKSIK